MPFTPFVKGGGKDPAKGKAKGKAKGGKKPVESSPKENPFAAKKTRRSPF
jgi:hypothetical protein